MSLIIPMNFKRANALDTTGAHGTTDAKFQKGDKVRVWQYPVYGKLGEVVEATYGSMEYTVNVEGKDYPRIDYRRIVKVSNAADDSAAQDAKFKIGDKVKVYHGTKDGKVLSVKEGMRGPIYEVQLGTLHGVPRVQVFKEKELVAANSRAGDAEENWIEKFEVGKVYRAPWDRNWLAKVLSRTDSSIRVATKTIKGKSWGSAEEQVTLRINKRMTEESGSEVAKGDGWEFWADEKAWCWPR